MTQDELGEILGVKKAAVQKWESGQVVNLKQSTILKLCEVFRRSPSVFIFDHYDDYVDLETMEMNMLREHIQGIYGEDAMLVLEGYIKLPPKRKEFVTTLVEDFVILSSVTKS
jgi:transcriptional regulator with XRE-family HTH domain